MFLNCLLVALTISLFQALLVEFDKCGEGQFMVNGVCKENKIVELPNKQVTVLNSTSNDVIIWSWGYIYENDKVYVQMGFQLPTIGWVGWGIGPHMYQATDMWIFQYDEVNHKMWVRDAFSNSYEPSYDTDNGGTEDIELLGYTRNGVTDVQFRRVQNTKDPHDQVLKQGNYYTIYAYGQSNEYLASYHQTNKGYSQWYLDSKCPLPSILIDGLCAINDVNPLKNVIDIQSQDVEMQFQWEFDPIDIHPAGVNMLIKIKSIYYFGFGLGSGMEDSDMWIFDIVDNGPDTNKSIIFKDSYSSGYYAPQSDVTLGGTADLQVLGSLYNDNGYTTVKFRRLLNTNDQYDKVIKEGWTNAIFATSSGSFTETYHYNLRGQFGFNFVRDQNDLTQPSNAYHLQTNLGIEMYFYWDFDNAPVQQQGVVMMIKINTPYFFAFGIGTTMEQADMWIFQIDPNSQTPISCTDSFSVGYYIPGSDVDHGGKNDIQILGQEYNVNGWTTIKFRRLLNTNDIYDVLLQQGPLQAMWASSKFSYETTFHFELKGLFQFNFVQNDISQLQKKIIVNNDFVYFEFQWDFDDNGKGIMMLIKINTPYYFAIGFGTGMDKAQDMWIFEIDTLETKISCRDMSSSQYSRPIDDSAQGGKNDIDIVGQQHWVDGWTIVKFHRLLQTKDQFDVDISQRLMPAMWAIGDGSYTLNYHKTKKGLFTIDLSEEDLTPPSNSQIVEKFTIYWDFLDTEVIMMIKAQTLGYFAIGFGPSMDKAADMWIFQYDEQSSKIIARDAYSISHTVPPDDETNNGKNDLQLMGQEYNNQGVSTVKFRRALNTHDVNDIILEQTQYDAMWAYGDVNQLVYHDTNRGNFLLSFNNDITPLPKLYTIKNQFVNLNFSWQFDSDGKGVMMMIQINTPYYFAIGFGGSMSTAKDMWIFEIDQELQKITCTDSSSTSESPPVSDIINGGKNDIRIVGQQYWKDNITTIKFYRLLNTNDNFDIELKQTVMPAMWAIGGQGAYQMAYHDMRKGLFTFDFREDDITPPANSYIIPSKYLKNKTQIQIQNQHFFGNSIARVNAFFAIGFGPNMMNGQDMWVFEYHTNSKTLSATDSYSDEYSYPKDDISNGGKNNLEVLGRDINNEGVTTVKFRRMLNTLDKNDIIISQKIYQAMWAHGEDQQYLVQYHGTNRGQFTLDLNPQKVDFHHYDSYFQLNDKEFFIKLSWQYDTQIGIVQMMIETNTMNYFALGFGGNKMNQAQDMWIFETVLQNRQQQTIKITDAFCNDHRSPISDEAFGGKNDIYFLGANFSDTVKVRFYRYNKTNDKNDIELNQQTVTAIWAHGLDGSTGLSNHGNFKGSFKFEFKEGAQKIIDQNSIDFIDIHKYVNIIGWGILVDIAIIFARYFQTKRWYLVVHGSFMLLLVTTTLYVEVVMIKNGFNSLSSADKINKLHGYLGISIVIWMLVQTFAGSFLAFKMRFSNEVTTNISTGKTIHNISGTLLYIVTKLNVFFGVQVQYGKQGSFAIFLYLCLALLLFVRVTIEIFYRKNSKIMLWLLGLQKKQALVADFDDSASVTSSSPQQKLLNYIELHDHDAIEAEFPQRNWVLFNNQVVDLTDLFHPGGQRIWDFVQGREVSRFIYGAYCLESVNMKPFTHSSYALKLIDKYTIGYLKEIPFFFHKSEPSTKSMVYQPLLEENFWRVQSVQQITESISLFGFLNSNDQLAFRSQLNGVELFGRHFIIKSLNNPNIATRPYTMIVCMSQINQEFRRNLIGFAVNKLDAQELLPLYQSTQLSEYFHSQSELPLVIKEYHSEFGFSQHIHSIGKDDHFQILGPYGSSFGLRQNQSGHLAIIAGGTGLLPFLDILDFLLRKTIYDILKTNTSVEIAEQTNPGKANFDMYFKDVKIHLLVAVQKREDLIGQDIILTLIKLQSLLRNENFSLVLRVDDGTQIQGVKCVSNQRFDLKFLQENLPNLNDIDKFLICGPPAMNKQVPENLLNVGVKKERILIV